MDFLLTELIISYQKQKIISDLTVNYSRNEGNFNVDVQIQNVKNLPLDGVNKNTFVVAKIS